MLSLLKDSFRVFFLSCVNIFHCVPIKSCMSGSYSAFCQFCAFLSSPDISVTLRARRVLGCLFLHIHTTTTIVLHTEVIVI